MITAKVFEKTDGDVLVLLMEDGKLLQQYGPAQFARGEAELVTQEDSQLDGGTSSFQVFRVITTVMVPETQVTEYEVTA